MFRRQAKLEAWKTSQVILRIEERGRWRKRHNVAIVEEGDHEAVKRLPPSIEKSGALFSGVDDMAIRAFAFWQGLEVNAPPPNPGGSGRTNIRYYRPGARLLPAAPSTRMPR